MRERERRRRGGFAEGGEPRWREGEGHAVLSIFTVSLVACPQSCTQSAVPACLAGYGDRDPERLARARPARPSQEASSRLARAVTHAPDCSSLLLDAQHCVVDIFGFVCVRVVPWLALQVNIQNQTGSRLRSHCLRASGNHRPGILPCCSSHTVRTVVQPRRTGVLEHPASHSEAASVRLFSLPALASSAPSTKASVQHGTPMSESRYRTERA